MNFAVVIGAAKVVKLVFLHTLIFSIENGSIIFFRNVCYKSESNSSNITDDH